MSSKGSHRRRYYLGIRQRCYPGNIMTTYPLHALMDIQDGVVVVWHDEAILATKCQDTEPAVNFFSEQRKCRVLIITQFFGDPSYPYVSKFIVNLTLAQLRTLDCGSKRQNDFPFQLTYPSTRISTLQEGERSLFVDSILS
jgi:glycerophosphoryl diester phosphodiesterase